MNQSHLRSASLYLLFFAALCSSQLKVKAQESYEIQVYASPTMTKGMTMFELHSNISPSGPKSSYNFTHPLHETLEITTGITQNFELGFYFFNRINSGHYNYCGSHIRPRITVPPSWHWNVGASLSFEAGFIKDPVVHATDWDYEIRPIIDKTWGRHYVAINPTLEGSFTTNEVAFSPNIKYAFAISQACALGLEYYGVLGSPFNWERYDQQLHQLYAVADLFVHPKYEINFGVGYGVTASSDMWNVKLILGRRVLWKKEKQEMHQG